MVALGTTYSKYMTQIEPVVFPLNQGTATQMSVLILSFSTDAITCTTYYELLTEDNKMLSNGNYTLTDVEFALWGFDNTLVDGYVANAIGVTIINQQP
jgi:hypothetical protein